MSCYSAQDDTLIGNFILKSLMINDLRILLMR
jgi:hypothetical protein